METNVSIKTLKSFVRKMRIPDGSVVLIKKGCLLDDNSTIKAFAEVLKRSGLTEVILVITEDFNDLKVLDGVDMQKYGWYRRENVDKLLRIPKK